MYEYDKGFNIKFDGSAAQWPSIKSTAMSYFASKECAHLCFKPRRTNVPISIPETRLTQEAKHESNVYCYEYGLPQHPSVAAQAQRLASSTAVLNAINVPATPGAHGSDPAPVEVYYNFYDVDLIPYEALTYVKTLGPAEVRADYDLARSVSIIEKKCIYRLQELIPGSVTKLFEEIIVHLLESSM
jgi:hypothetical protein